MTRGMRWTRWVGVTVGLAVLVLLGACGSGGDGDESGDGGGTGGSVATSEVAAIVTREEVFACLDDASLQPEDAGLFMTGSEGTEVEAIGVRLDAGLVQIWVFDDAETAEEQVAAWERTEPGPNIVPPAETTAAGNVAVAYESSPTDADLDAIEACLPAG